MKVAISSNGKNLDSQIDPRFGRCAYFLLVDTDDLGFEVFENENAALGGGAGIQSAQFVTSKGAEAVITGNCGPNAVKTLSAAGVVVILNQRGTVREAIKNYEKENLKGMTDPDVTKPFTIGGDSAAGRGAGDRTRREMGRGMRGGRGMGRGKGGRR